jgi:hypothetical protein
MKRSVAVNYSLFFEYKLYYYMLVVFLFFFISVNKIFARQIIDMDIKSNRQIKIFSEEYAANFVFINQEFNIAINTGLLSSNIFIDLNNIDSTSFFSIFLYGKSKYGIHSCVDVNDISLIAYLVKRISIKFRQLFTGVFFEYSNGDYDIYSKYNTKYYSLVPVRDNKDIKYFRGGLLKCFDFNNNFYNRDSIRIDSIIQNDSTLGIKKFKNQ